MADYHKKVQSDEILIHLVGRGAERRQVALHLYYPLLGEILTEMEQAFAGQERLGVNRV